MSRFVFPYGIRFQENGRVEVFPAAEIFVFGRGRRGIRAIFHIDSGATTSIMPFSDVETLGLIPDTSKKIIVRGIAQDQLTGYYNFVKAQFNGSKIEIPVIFVKDYQVPRILGREGIFDKFGIIFDEPKRRTALLDSNKYRKTIDSVFDTK